MNNNNNKKAMIGTGSWVLSQGTVLLANITLQNGENAKYYLIERIEILK
jgi:hypothetical protein